MNIEDFSFSGIASAERHLVENDGKVELFPLVDEEGNVLGSITRSEAHSGAKSLHAVVHLHVYNSQGELYLQQRAMWKDIQPGKWDTATGGHIDYGETVGKALMREVHEEIGLAPGTYEPKFLGKYVYESTVEREMVYVFSTVYDGELYPSTTETDGGRFWAMDDIMDNIGKDVFTPMFEQEILRIKNSEFYV